ncbi:MAG: helix-turn-helix domain-containing protein, partial [Oscillospiraceae bacterium]|nr:helix-turn-helix domain-containing protein [Oscillospiraceae bacterium]
MTIGQRIAQKRKERGLSQEALGEALGVSRQSVYKWDSVSALPDIDKLIALSRMFGVTVGWLLG